jgi:hypothetical protein
MKRTVIHRGIAYCAEKEIFNFLNDRQYLSLIFWARTGETLNLKAPKTLNEKIQWLKLYDRKETYTKLVDKYEVREYITNVLGEQYLIPLIGSWDNFDSIDFDTLPNQFVLKCNHDSGGIVICRDKSSFDFYNAKLRINKYLSRNYYRSREWPYKNVRPRIIAEKLMLDERGNLPDDYKIMCFNGNVDNIMVCTGRFSADGVKFFFFDKDWNFLRYDKGDELLPDDFTLEKPKNLDEMIEVAAKLAAPFPFVRIDLYNIDGRVYFGEITLSPQSGFDSVLTYEADLLFGNKLDIK